jgi:hypothetical protein
MKVFGWVPLILFAFAGPVSAAGLENQGQISLFGSSMPAQNLPEASQNGAGAEVSLHSRYNFNKYIRFHFQSWYKGDGLSRDPAERNQFELQDLSLELKKSSRKIKLGFSTINWEGTDFLNPMDLISVKNWRDPLNPQNRGMAGAFYSDQIGDFSWDLVYIPVQSKPELPGEKSPWWPRRINLPVERDDMTLLLPDHVAYDIQSDETLDRAFLNNAALRLQYHGDNWDFSVGAHEGVAGTPLLLPIVDVTPIEVSPKQIYLLNSPVRIQPLYYRERSVAFALVKSAGTWIFRLTGQHAQSLGEDPRLPGWSEYGVLGVEKNIEWGEQGITLLFQYTQSRRPQSETVSLLSSLLEKAAMFGWRWPVTEKWTWNTALFQEQKYYSLFLHSDVKYSLGDHWSVGAGGDIFSGSRDSVIGIYDHNSRVTSQISYLF